MKLFFGGLLRTCFFAFVMLGGAGLIFGLFPASSSSAAQNGLFQVMSIAILFSPPLYLLLDLILFTIVRATWLRGFLVATLMGLLFATVCALSALTVA